MSHLNFQRFSEIDLSDRFFDSLKADYEEFEEWYGKKSDAGAQAYCLYDDNEALVAFLYLKVEGEDENHSNITPLLPPKKRLKVGTLKIEAHGTRLGERVIKKVMDQASEFGLEEIYVTVFPKHRGLIQGLLRYGFEEFGVKTTSNGKEKVFIKNLCEIKNDIYKDYPLVNIANCNFWSLSIYPQFHTEMFPDSILNHESYDLLSDVAPTNTIRKIYICKIDCLLRMSPGDVIFIYRTTDGQAPAHYRSVVTSVCVVDEIKNMHDFSNEDAFVAYCLKSSIFSEAQLRKFYREGKYPYIIKMTYNIAFTRRVTKQLLQEYIGVSPSYWGCFQLNKTQAKSLFELGECNSFLIRE